MDRHDGLSQRYLSEAAVGGRLLPGTTAAAAVVDEAPARKRTLWPVVSAAFGLGVLLFWYTPASLYANNERQFYFPLLQILPVLVAPLALTVVVLVVPALVMPAQVRRLYAAFLACVMAYLWVQGFLLVRDFGLLDGEIELPSFAPGPVIVSAVIIVSASVLLSFRVMRAAVVLAVFSAALLTHLGFLLASDSNPVRTLAPSRLGSVYELGAENVIVVLLDALQSDVFAQVLRDRPDINARLDGFTYYPNTLGVGRSTYVALPTIHSGRLHQPGTSMQEHFDRSIGRDSFLTDLADAGQQVTLLNPVAGVCPRRIDACVPYDESRTTSSTVRLVKQSAELVDLALFRLAPPELKGAVYNADQWRLQALFDASSTNVASDAALRDFTTHLEVGESGKTAKFLHLQSTHAPATRRSDCSLREKPLAITRKTALEVSTCALTRVGALVDELKRLGAYDKTSIVVLSDHGYRAGRVPSPRVESSSWKDLIGNANPLLAVKPAGARGRLRSSDAEMSIADVKGIICSLTQDCANTAVDWRTPDGDRPRFFMTYSWRDQSWFAPTLIGEQRFEVRGPMFEPASWRELPKGSVPSISRLTFGRSDLPDHFSFGWGPIRGTEGGREWRWALGSQASLFLSLPDDADSRLELDVGSLPEHPRQAVTFEVNGRMLGKKRVRGSSDRISLVVPRGAAGKDIDEIVMSFDAHRTGEPEAERHKRRLRSLAVRFDELRITYGDDGASPQPTQP